VKGFRMIRICPECGGSLERARVVREVQAGHHSIPVEVEVSRCSSCGEILLAAGQMRDMQRRAAEIARQEDGLLAPDEIRALRERYHLSREAFERLIKAGPKTVTRWERGTVCQNGTADTLMRLLRDDPAIAARLAAERSVDIRYATPASSAKRKTVLRRPSERTQAEETVQVLRVPCDLCERVLSDRLVECTVDQAKWYKGARRARTQPGR
jgi:HTH-type transcriptional regulator / antitoxin MqsA